jgi:hypothetical protein
LIGVVLTGVRHRPVSVDFIPLKPLVFMAFYPDLW